MKRVFPVLFLLLFLVGCGGSSEPLDCAMTLRSKLLQSAGCDFSVRVTADYSDELYVFRMQCKCDNNGNITFCVISPESISGITGMLTTEGGHLTFDGNALLFPLMADGRFSPVSGPWIIMRALRSGYIRGCGKEEQGVVIHLDDTYDAESLQVIVRTNDDLIPISGEIFFRGNRILTILIEDFSFL